jgi:coenzyme PQQ precursor peptide PqqA
MGLSKITQPPTGNLPKPSQANFHFTFDRGGALGRGVASPQQRGRTLMSWSTPILVEICIGLEINGYLPAEF